MSIKARDTIILFFARADFNPIAVRVLDKVYAHLSILKAYAAHFPVMCKRLAKVVYTEGEMRFVVAKLIRAVHITQPCELQQMGCRTISEKDEPEAAIFSLFFMCGRKSERFVIEIQRFLKISHIDIVVVKGKLHIMILLLSIGMQISISLVAEEKKMCYTVSKGQGVRMMSVKVEVKLDVESMADFMIYHIYTSGAGMTALILGMLNVGLTIAFVMKRQFLLAAVFLLFVCLVFIVFPVFIRKKVIKQMQNSRRLEETVTYEFMDDGILTTTSEDSGKASWSKFKRAISRKQIIFLYDAQKRAIILPVSQLGDRYTEIVDMIFAHMPAPAVRIRRMDGRKGTAPRPRKEADRKAYVDGKVTREPEVEKGPEE